MYRFVLAVFLSLAGFFSFSLTVYAEQDEAMRELTQALQTELARVGCSPGDVDGYWGNNSYLAMKAYNQATGEKLRVYKASQEALDSVKAQTGRICKSVCGDGEQCMTGQITKQNDNHPYDGVYQISGERIQNKKKVFCSETFEIEFKVQNGEASHKIPLGHMLSGKVKENRLHISSPAERSGGHWVGLFALGSQKDAVTTGTFKWMGAKDGATCAYQAIIRRL